MDRIETAAEFRQRMSAQIAAKEKPYKHLSSEMNIGKDFLNDVRDNLAGSSVENSIRYVLRQFFKDIEIDARDIQILAQFFSDFCREGSAEQINGKGKVGEIYTTITSMLEHYAAHNAIKLHRRIGKDSIRVCDWKMDPASSEVHRRSIGIGEDFLKTVKYNTDGVYLEIGGANFSQVQGMILDCLQARYPNVKISPDELLRLYKYYQAFESQPFADIGACVNDAQRICNQTSKMLEFISKDPAHRGSMVKGKPSVSFSQITDGSAKTRKGRRTGRAHRAAGAKKTHAPRAGSARTGEVLTEGRGEIFRRGEVKEPGKGRIRAPKVPKLWR